MPKLSSIATLASAAMIAATLTSPVSAAALRINNVGAGARVGAVHTAIGGGRFTPMIPAIATQTPHHGPKYQKPQWKWVCGPLLNYDGTKHCHWVKH